MSDGADGRARDRFAILLGLRIGGAALLAVGLYVLLGGTVAGGSGFGLILGLAGAVAAFILPTILARRWRSRR